MMLGKRREERMRIYEHAGMIWTLATGALDEYQLGEFIRCGAVPPKQPMPYMPEVEAKVAEIVRNGGRLIVERQGE